MTDTTDIAALREASEIGESSDYMTWPKVDPAKLKRVLDQLEAERQRADEAIQLNPLAVDVSELEATYIGDIRIHMATISEYKQRAESAEAKIAALKAKLANPVVLPQ